MKKNDSLSLLVYVLMIAVVLVVGLTIIRPAVSNSTTADFGGLNPMVVLIITIVAGLVVIALLNEIAHVIGAKIGHYKIRSVIVLGLGWKRTKEGKGAFAAGGFDGLTGETKLIPADVEKNSLKPYIYFPYLFYLLEIAACVALVIISQLEAYIDSMKALYVVSITLLTLVAIIFFYDAFPFQLDTTNDGYRLSIVSNPKNRKAYNQILLTEDCRLMGDPIPEMEPYEDLTDFTASINSAIIYDKLEKGEYEEAISINELTVTSKGVSKGIHNEAVAIKLSMILLQNKKEEGRAYLDSLNTEEKKYIVGMNSMAALRAYLLVSALLDESQSESEIAIARKISVIKKCDKSTKKTESRLYKESLELADKTHPEWGLVATETNPEAEAAAEEVEAEASNPIVEALEKKEVKQEAQEQLQKAKDEVKEEDKLGKYDK